jgi:hypothetical protein
LIGYTSKIEIQEHIEMSTLVGNCPYCDGVVSYETKEIRGRNTKLYSCSNHKVTTEDGETWELRNDATCSFKIFGNALSRYGKKFIGPKEVKKLINGEAVVAHLYSFNKKTEYKKYLTLDKEYGVSVLWDLDVEDNEVA